LRDFGDPVIVEVRAAFNLQKAVPEFIHNWLIKLIHEYLVVGSMTDPVNTFIQDLI